jgi:hypothetical protein
MRAHFKKQGNDLSAPAYESCAGETFAERYAPLAAIGLGRKARCGNRNPAFGAVRALATGKCLSHK